MNENTLLAIVCSIAIAGCATCHVSDHRREIEIERIRVEERGQILTPLEQP